MQFIMLVKTKVYFFEAGQEIIKIKWLKKCKVKHFTLLESAFLKVY